MKTTLPIAALGISLALGAVFAANAADIVDSTRRAPIAGQSKGSVTVTDVNQIARGWSAEKSILGKTIYNETGAEIGEINDLIVSPGRNVSYLIIGAGGFVGLGEHAVAVPITQLRERDGKIVWSGATKVSVKAMPEFKYTAGAAVGGPAQAGHGRHAAQAEREVMRADDKMAMLQKRADTGTNEDQTRIGTQITDIRTGRQSVQDKLSEMRGADMDKQASFESDLDAATAHLRQLVDQAAG